MKNKFLAMALSAVAVSSANAVEVYNDGEKTLSISGRIKGYATNARGVDEGLGYNDGSSRMSFFGANQVSESLKLFGGTEWSINAAAHGGSSDFIGLRLAYLGADTDFGTFSAGTQWASFSNVSLYTDVFEFQGSSGTMMYNDGSSGGLSGLARASESLMYTFTSDKFRVSATVQGTGDFEEVALASSAADEVTRNFGFGGSAELMLAGGDVTVGVAGHMTNVDLKDGSGNVLSSVSDNRTPVSFVGAVKANLLDSRVYVAGTFAMHQDAFLKSAPVAAETTAEAAVIAESADEYGVDAMGMELFAAYFYDVELQSGVYVGYNNVLSYESAYDVSTDFSDYAPHYVEVGARHAFATNTFVFAAYNHDLRSGDDRSAESDGPVGQFALGARYEF